MSQITIRSSLAIPALRGTFGSWVYYSCLMPTGELAERTDYANALPPAKAEELAHMSEYVLDGHQAVEIAQYLATTEDGFLNSLVLAVYGGKPDWLEIRINGTNTPNVSLSELSEETKDSIGFLRLSGEERIFVIDGRHRLAGIKRAIHSNISLRDEFVPVILVGHTNTLAAFDVPSTCSQHLIKLPFQLQSEAIVLT